jgi:hypothetical protein
MRLVEKLCGQLKPRPAIISLNPFTIEEVLQVCVGGGYGGAMGGHEGGPQRGGLSRAACKGPAGGADCSWAQLPAAGVLHSDAAAAAPPAAPPPAAPRTA